MIMQYRKTLSILLGLGLMTASVTVAAAQEVAQMRAARLGASDPVKLATFYETAFGFTLLRRIDGPTYVEMVLRARDAPAGAASLILMTRPGDLPVGGFPYVILGVSDVDRAVAAAIANGGTKVSEPRDGAGVRYAMIKDPEGNQVEVLMPQ